MNFKAGRAAFPFDRLSMPFVVFDGPSAAIVRRDVSRLFQEQGLRFLVPTLLGVNALIAYALSSILDDIEFDFISYIVLTQWLSVYGIGLMLIAARAGTSIGTERSRDTWPLVRATPATIKKRASADALSVRDN